MRAPLLYGAASIRYYDPLHPIQSGITMKNATMINLAAGMCRWPVGDPKNADFHFCGGPSDPGLSYCEEHMRLAHSASTRKVKAA